MLTSDEIIDIQMRVQEETGIGQFMRVGMETRKQVGIYRQAGDIKTDDEVMMIRAKAVAVCPETGTAFIVFDLYQTTQVLPVSKFMNGRFVHVRNRLDKV